jgi:hypothetical protein
MSASTADLLEYQAREHENRDKHREPNQQFQDVGFQEMQYTVCQDFHYIRASPEARG